STISLGCVSLIGTSGMVWQWSACCLRSRRRSEYPFHGTVPAFLSRHTLVMVFPAPTRVQSGSVTSAMNTAASPLYNGGAQGGLVERTGQPSGDSATDPPPDEFRLGPPGLESRLTETATRTAAPMMTAAVANAAGRVSNRPL